MTSTSTPPLRTTNAIERTRSGHRMRPGPTMRRLAGLVAASIAAVACSSGSQLAAPSTTSTAQSTKTSAPVVADCGNPVASYQPTFVLPAPNAMPAGTYLKTIQDRGKLIVGTASDVLLFSYRNPLSGQLEGFDIDVAHAIAKAIFGDPNKIEYRVINYAQRLPAITSGSVDIVADTMTINCNRWAQIAFSTEYYHAGQKVLVRSDSTATTMDDVNKVGGQRVCAAKGSTNIVNLGAYKNVMTVPVDDLTDCLVLFQQGAVDAITADDTVLKGFKAQDKYANVIGPEFSSELYGIGASLKYPELTQFVNLVLEQMRTDGSLLALNTKWLEQTTAPPAAVYGRLPAG